MPARINTMQHTRAWRSWLNYDREGIAHSFQHRAPRRQNCTIFRNKWYRRTEAIRTLAHPSLRHEIITDISQLSRVRTYTYVNGTCLSILRRGWFTPVRWTWDAGKLIERHNLSMLVPTWYRECQLSLREAWLQFTTRNRNLELVKITL